MTLSNISLLLLVMQVLLLVGTMFFGPLFLQACWKPYLCYTIVVGVVWFAYTIVAMVYNSEAGIDVPGFGYMVVGFIGWIFGSAIYILRIRRRINNVNI